LQQILLCMEAVGGILLICFGLGWIILSFHYAKVYWENYNWAWAIFIFVICMTISPYVFFFIRKLLEGTGNYR